MIIERQLKNFFSYNLDLTDKFAQSIWNDWRTTKIIDIHFRNQCL